MLESSSATPQFNYADRPDADRCTICGQAVGSRYYRIGGNMTCAACAEKARFEQPKDSHTAYIRALLFGIGAAIVGLIVYATFGIVTGLVIGYLSLAVGYMIGKAMTAGSKGLGGRKYQVTAALLTYVAVSMAAVPIGIAQYVKAQKAQTTH